MLSQSVQIIEPPTTMMSLTLLNLNDNTHTVSTLQLHKHSNGCHINFTMSTNTIDE